MEVLNAHLLFERGWCEQSVRLSGEAARRTGPCAGKQGCGFTLPCRRTHWRRPHPHLSSSGLTRGSRATAQASALDPGARSLNARLAGMTFGVNEEDHEPRNPADRTRPCPTTSGPWECSKKLRRGRKVVPRYVLTRRQDRRLAGLKLQKRPALGDLLLEPRSQGFRIFDNLEQRFDVTIALPVELLAGCRNLGV